MKLSKKKKEIEIVESKTEDVEIGADPKEEPKELTEEQKELVRLVQYYKEHYEGVFVPANFPGMADQTNILFGILAELKLLNEQITAMREEE